MRSDRFAEYRRGMSVSTVESELRSARKALEDARKKQAAEEKKAADADKAAASKEQSAARTSSASLAKSYLRDAQRKRDEAAKARAKAADHSKKAATAQGKVHTAEEKLAKAQAAEAKKRDDQAKRDRTKREQAERRQREQAERVSRQAAREQQRMEEARRRAEAERDWRLAEVGNSVEEAHAVLRDRPWEDAPEKITVLFLTGEPEGTARLKLGHEVREIQEQVRKSKHRDAIDFQYRPATRYTDMMQHLNDIEPDVIHFSGHGANSGIALHSENDQVRLMTNDELGRVLGVAPKPLKLVVFNSCNSEEQARVAAGYAAAAIGMQQSIEDEVARVFAGQLYNSLGFGRSLSLAMRQAELFLEMRLNRTSGEPTLVLGDGVDADELIIVAPPER